jgi:hypothetical protein
MTYLFNGKQYIVVAVGWKDMPAEQVALALSWLGALYLLLSDHAHP